MKMSLHRGFVFPKGRETSSRFIWHGLRSVALIVVLLAAFCANRIYGKKHTAKDGGGNYNSLVEGESNHFETKVKQAYRTWASRQPDPNAPALFVMDGHSYSVRELVENIEQGTPLGRLEIDSLRDFAEEHPQIGV